MSTGRPHPCKGSEYTRAAEGLHGKRPFSKSNPSGRVANTAPKHCRGAWGGGVTEAPGEGARAALGIIGGSRLNPGGAAWCTCCAQVLGRELRAQ